MASATGARIPRWSQIEMVIRNRILAGNYQANDRMPGEVELAREFGVTRMTVRQALDRLADDGLVIRRQGVGTMVTSSHHPAPLALMGYLEDLLILFSRTEVIRAEVREVVPSPRVRKLLESDQEKFTYISRLRKSNGELFSVSRSYLPWVLQPSLDPNDLKSNLLFEILDAKYGIKLADADQVIRCRPADKATAEALGLQLGATVVVMQLRYSGTVPQQVAQQSSAVRKTIAVTEMDIRPDKFLYHVHLVRLS